MPQGIGSSRARAPLSSSPAPQSRSPRRRTSSISEKPMVDLRRVIRDDHSLPEAPREWLVENGLGGYASATITGAITRRYHGFLIAAQPAPLGRMVVLNDLEVDVELETGSVVVNLREKGRFLDFTLDMGLPSWRYELDGVVIEKSIVVPSRQNIVHCTFRLLNDGGRVHLRLRPLINFRRLEAPLSEALASGYTLTVRDNRYEISAGLDLPTLRLAVENSEGPTFTADGGSRREQLLRDRGAARLRFARLAVEPRLLYRRGPQGLPADPDRRDGSLAYRAGAKPRGCTDLRERASTAPRRDGGGAGSDRVRRRARP